MKYASGGSSAGTADDNLQGLAPIPMLRIAAHQNRDKLKPTTSEALLGILGGFNGFITVKRATGCLDTQRTSVMEMEETCRATRSAKKKEERELTQQ